MPYREPLPPDAVPAPVLPRPPMAVRTGNLYVLLAVFPLPVAFLLALESQVEVAVVIVAVWLLAASAWVFSLRRSAKGDNAANLQAVTLIREGEPRKAAVILDALLARSFANPARYSLYLLNRGVAALEMGNLADARAMLCGVQQRVVWLEKAFPPFVPVLLEALGRTEALAGDLDAAEKWQGETRARLVSGSVTALQLDVIIAARRGRLDDAEALLQLNWNAAEGRMTAPAMKLVRVLRAFVANRRTPDDDGAVEVWLAGVRPVRGGMFTYLGTQWPDFAAFERKYLPGAEAPS